jgi:hypothetical protein
MIKILMNKIILLIQNIQQKLGLKIIIIHIKGNLVLHVGHSNLTLIQLFKHY